MKNVFVKEFPFISPDKIYPLIKDEKCVCWLDNWPVSSGNYSLIGLDPFLIFSSKKRNISIYQNGSEEIISGNPLRILKNVLKNYRIDFPYYFGPGAIGYIGYDLGWQIEKLPDASVDDINIPDVWLAFYRSLLVFDRQRKKIVFISGNFRENNKDFELRCKDTVKKWEKVFKKSENKENFYTGSFNIQSVSSNITHEQYVNSIYKIKNYIARGDVYQINFAQRFQFQGEFCPVELFSRFKKVNPTFFSGFIDTGNFQIVSNSPELFLYKEGRKVVTRPMKGTRLRGKNKLEDKMFERELMKSIKDKAELIMIVDLERNDLGKVCSYGSVRVKQLQVLEKYKTVFHTTSPVEGFLQDNVDVVGLLKATFPGGSITGAPKIRAMEIIEELEPNKRGFYTGSMGYIGFTGNMLLNILIRTVLLKEKNLYYPAGGGIVWDSHPEREYEETIAKAKTLWLALGFKNEKEFTKVLV